MTRDEAIKALAETIAATPTFLVSQDAIAKAITDLADAIREDVLNTEIATWPAVQPAHRIHTISPVKPQEFDVDRPRIKPT